ncbi:hypothetical protein GUA87_15735 [Sneathiella sp. P13V-1]|uniref:DUF6468 domain-containing protein n=1 Tax=Sneathiella sp. P13V-1 TaxID=2697366 RepID=UPI00187BB8B9|nr:DUF6468 domain-containing protein [Sneathiella sp. P13V-1]MBE7638309.1 hypothetical protein [Sneathiella sp. P13V-1]
MAEFLSIPVLLDLLLIFMLGATIAYCVNLSRKLSVMRDAQQELHKVAEDFDRAIVRSKLGIEELKSASETIGQDLQQELDEAKGLLEELKLINASSSRIADKLQESVDGSGRQIASRQEDTATDSSEETSSGIEPRTEAERELLQMLTKSK